MCALFIVLLLKIRIWFNHKLLIQYCTMKLYTKDLKKKDFSMLIVRVRFQVKRLLTMINFDENSTTTIRVDVSEKKTSNSSTSMIFLWILILQRVCWICKFLFTDDTITTKKSFAIEFIQLKNMKVFHFIFFFSYVPVTHFLHLRLS